MALKNGAKEQPPIDPHMHPSRATQIKVGEEDDRTFEQRRAAAVANIPSVDIDLLRSIFDERTTTAICQLYGKIVAKPGRKAREFGNLQSEVIADKQKRTDAHVTVRQVFGGRIETMTEEDNIITIKAAAAQRGNRDARSLYQGPGGPRPKGKVGWDELGGEHLHFTLYKENKDTMEVLFFLASRLKLHAKNFQIAGTKDRRGVTVQRVSAFRITKERLQGLDSQLRQAKLSSYSYEQSGLELGQLWGNEFIITLRDCQIPSGETMGATSRLGAVRDAISKAMTAFQTYGFINYYGLQRFGSYLTSTDEIGKRMLKGDLKGAVAGLLHYPEFILEEARNPTEGSKISSDDLARAEALHIWKTTRKVGAVLDKLPRRFQAENAIIRYLGWTDKKSGQQKRLDDWQGALQQIARNLRLMYVHAYQSLVWNNVAARRWQTYGVKVVEGDLVIVGDNKDDGRKAEDEEEFDDAGEVIVRPAADDSAAALADQFERARPLSREEAESGSYSIFDIVLPLPGFDVVYSSNAIGDYYKEFMASEAGGGLNPHDMRRSWRDISLSGSYRKVMSRPVNLSYEIKVHSHEDEQLVQTDLERLQAEAQKAGDASEAVEAGAQPAAFEGDKKIALVLKMQLGSSQYATMALRELTKGGALSYKPDFQGGR